MAARGTFIEKVRIRISQIVMGTLLLSLLVVEPRLPGAHPLAANLLFALGCVFTGFGALGRIWCSLYIGGFKNRVVVEDGPYSLTRNPLYFFSCFGGLGLMLLTQTLTYPLVFLAFMSLYYPAVIRNEEARLLATHGDLYRDYFSRVPRFFPRLAKPNEPKRYEVAPRSFRKNLTDAAWFIWAIPLLFLLGQARAALGLAWFAAW